MLVLTRRQDEEIVIEGGIRIVVLGVEGNRARIGIIAPPSVRVDRKEIHDRFATPASVPIEKEGRPLVAV
jgi:carbon storage regulator